MNFFTVLYEIPEDNEGVQQTEVSASTPFEAADLVRERLQENNPDDAIRIIAVIDGLPNVILMDYR